MIVLKKRPLLTKPKVSNTESDSDEDQDNSSAPLPVVSNGFKIPWRKDKVKEKSADFFVIDDGSGGAVETTEPAPSQKLEQAKTKTETKDPVLLDDDLQKLLDKAVCGPAFEKNYGETAKLLGKRALKKMRKMEREKTKGRDWFDLPASELTEEAKADLELLQMRAAIDPLAFYRRNDRQVLPKYFQVGRIVDAPEDFYSSRIPKKDRKRTILDELLNDEHFIQSSRKKYNLLKEREKRKRRGAFQHFHPRRKRREKTDTKKKSHGGQ